MFLLQFPLASGTSALFINGGVYMCADKTASLTGLYLHLSACCTAP